MVRRTATKGPNKGSEFWGCLRFPKCKETVYDDDKPKKQLVSNRDPANNNMNAGNRSRNQDPAPNEPDAAGRWTPNERREVLRHLYERDGGRCGICGAEVPLEIAQVEHVVPRVFAYFSVRKGGKADKSGGYYKSKMHGYDNLQVAHPHCNKHKGNKAAVKEWRHSKMPPLVVAIADDGKVFTTPWVKSDGLVS